MGTKTMLRNGKIQKQVQKCHDLFAKIPRQAQVLKKYPNVWRDQDEILKDLANMTRGIPGHKSSSQKSKPAPRAPGNYATNFTGLVNMARQISVFDNKSLFEEWKGDFERIFAQVKESIAKGELKPPQIKYWQDSLEAVNELCKLVAESMPSIEGVDLQLIPDLAPPPTETPPEEQPAETPPASGTVSLENPLKGLEVKISKFVQAPRDTQILPNETWDLRSRRALRTGPPMVPTKFTITEPWLVQELVTLHYNGGKGVDNLQDASTPRAIALRAVDGTIYGPWLAWLERTEVSFKHIPGILHADAMQIIPPGTYEVLDSDPMTWTRDEASGMGQFYGSGCPLGGLAVS